MIVLSCCVSGCRRELRGGTHLRAYFARVQCLYMQAPGSCNGVVRRVLFLQRAAVACALADGPGAPSVEGTTLRALRARSMEKVPMFRPKKVPKFRP